MNKIIKFYDFCNNYCEKNEKNEKKNLCINNCNIVLNTFFKQIEKYSNEHKMNSYKLIKDFEIITPN